jgi:predicted ATPase
MSVLGVALPMLDGRLRLLAALRETSRHSQILVTSHSPDLLDNSDIPVEALLETTSDA